MPPAHPPEFRRRMIDLARLGDKSIPQVAKDVGVSESCLRNWVHQDDELLADHQAASLIGHDPGCTVDLMAICARCVPTWSRSLGSPAVRSPLLDTPGR